MKIDTHGYSCFQVFQRCLLWFCCKRDTNTNTNTTSDIPQTVTNDKLLEEKQQIFDDLCNLNNDCWGLEDIQEAVSSCPDYTSALQYLSHECQICSNQYPYSKFVKMTHCNCSFCERCFIHHFSSVIKEKNIMYFFCPICRKPDLQNKGDEFMEFFNLLDTQIHHYLDQETHELFQRKLRDSALMQMPNFRWCSHCPFGILHEEDTLQMECPECGKSTCFNCKEQWEDIHENLTCEEFKALKLQQKANELGSYLDKHGIVCPACELRYDLWKGGCLHFKCSQCQYEFCGGCRQPFHQGTECGFSDECHGKGLHAHHTRDCFYYLRDWDIERLQQLLQESGIQYNDDDDDTKQTPSPNTGNVKKTVSYNRHDDQAENKEGHGIEGLEDKEFLVKMINTNLLDPADLYTEEEMKVELHRWNVTIPEHCEDDNEETYLQKIKMIIKHEIPLFENPD